MELVQDYKPIKELSQQNKWFWKNNILFFEDIRKYPIIKSKDDIIYLFYHPERFKRFIKVFNILKESDYNFIIVHSRCLIINSEEEVIKNMETYFKLIVNLFTSEKRSDNDLSSSIVDNLIKYCQVYNISNLELLQYYDNFTSKNSFIRISYYKDDLISLKRDIQLKFILDT